MSVTVRWNLLSSHLISWRPVEAHTKLVSAMAPSNKWAHRHAYSDLPVLSGSWPDRSLASIQVVAI